MTAQQTITIDEFLCVRLHDLTAGLDSAVRASVSQPNISLDELLTGEGTIGELLEALAFVRDEYAAVGKHFPPDVEQLLAATRIDGPPGRRRVARDSSPTPANVAGVPFMPSPQELRPPEVAAAIRALGDAASAPSNLSMVPRNPYTSPHHGYDIDTRSG